MHYKIKNISFTKKDIYLTGSGLVIGTCLGITILSFMVPDATKWLALYHDEKLVLREIKKNGVPAVQEDMWLHYAESLKAKSQNEYISDIININNTSVLVTNRLMLGVYPSTPELREFGDKLIKSRQKENDELKKIEETMQRLEK